MGHDYILCTIEIYFVYVQNMELSGASWSFC